MKQTIACIAFVLCLLLVLFAQPAMQAAQTGLSLWWNTLLPTLFPFFACATLIERTGALHLLANALFPLSRKLRISHYALPVLLLGGMSGYPSGARLCGMLRSTGCISDEEAERLGTVCNLCSPMFLIGAVAGGIFGNIGLFPALVAGHYGGAILIALLLRFLRPIPPATPPALHKAEGEPLYRALPRTIADGMFDMLRVGGTVMFFFVVAELLFQIGLLQFIGRPLDAILPVGSGAIPASQGMLLGLLEMTGGCHLLLQSGLTVRMSAALCAFLISFGGMSVFVQAMAFVQFQHPMRYIRIKLLHGAIAAMITYAMVSRTTGATEVFASASSPYLVNAMAGGTVLFACVIGVLTAFLFALLFGKRRRTNA